MKNNLRKIVIGLLVVAGLVIVKIAVFKGGGTEGEVIQVVKPTIGNIYTTISTTGTVLPKNRLEIKPPVNGRIESVEVKEGEQVKIGQILAWMSSTERAALLDNARGQGEESLKYWEDAYKPIPLSAPINGEVIVATTQPGQTVTTTDAVVVLSDKLIVRAQVDETDIGKIKLGQEAVITLDAYPDTAIKARVDHIYYESETSNNVTIYKVDLIPEEVPAFFRSGMNATVDFKVEAREKALLVPVGAVHRENNESYVLLKENGGQNPIKRIIKTGITDDKNYEVISGITADDAVVITTKEYSLPTSGNTGSNPFLPKMPSHNRSKNTQSQK
jgi:macrolide-specific efflux system membrane fusion protein